MFPRPTIRAYKKLYSKPLPPIQEQMLHEIEFSVLKKIPTALNAPKKILCVTDNVFYKSKVGDLRGAIYLSQLETWLVDFGHRKYFYDVLEKDCQSALANNRKNNILYKRNHKTDSDFLLPQDDDYLRLRLEKAMLVTKRWKARFLGTVILARMNKNQSGFLTLGNWDVEILCVDDNNETILYVGTKVNKSNPEMPDPESQFLLWLDDMLSPSGALVEDCIPGGQANSQAGYLVLAFYLK